MQSLQVEELPRQMPRSPPQVTEANAIGEQGLVRMVIRGCPCVPGQRAGHSRKVLKAVVGHVLWDLTQAGDVTGLPSPDPARRTARIRPDCAATSPTFAIASGARPGSQTTDRKSTRLNYRH